MVKLMIKIVYGPVSGSILSSSIRSGEPFAPSRTLRSGVGSALTSLITCDNKG